MQGYPAQLQVHLGNWRTAPYNRWAFQHVRELVPSADVANDPKRVSEFPAATVDLSSVTFSLTSGETVSLEAFCDRAFADGVLVLQDGAIVHQQYYNGMTPDTSHILMSVSKSVLGILTGILEHKGLLDASFLVTDILPELQDTAYKGATLRHLLDMRVGIEFDEDYLATSGAIIDYRKATNWNPLEPGESPSDLRSFYQQLTGKDGEHGGRFHYVSPNTDLMAWLIERATGSRYADLLSEHLWQPLGAAKSAYITVDRFGAPRAAGGLCATLPDLARIAQLIVDDGVASGKQILPPGWVNDLETGGDKAAWAQGGFAADFPGQSMSYRNKWYASHQTTDWLMAVGVHGQNIYVNRARHFAMVKLSSSPAPIDGATMADGLSAARAIADCLGA